MSNSNTKNTPKSHKDDDEIDLTRLFSALWLNKTWIGLAMTLGLLLGGLYAFSAKPVYQADALLQIESKTKGNILGDLGGLAAAGGLAGAGSSDAAAETQILKSRFVLGHAVDTLNLSAEANYVKSGLFNGLFDEKRTEQPQIVLSQLIVPSLLQTKKFVITIKDAESYEIKTPSGEQFTAKVGEVFTSPSGIVSAITAFKNVKPGDAFEVHPVSRQMAIKNVTEAFSAAETGRNTNILGLSYTDTDPLRTQSVLETIVDFYKQQNREYAAQVDGASLDFVTKELPNIRQRLEQAENALNAFRNKNATIDIAAESKGVVESLSQIEMQLIDLKARESEAAQIYTVEHPVYKAISEKIAVLNDAKRQLVTRISGMPTTQQDMIRLRRDVDVQQAIYMQLMQKQQELNVLRASKLGNIRIIDSALTAEKPIKPKKALILAAATLGAGMLAALFFILRTLFRRGIDDAETLENMGIPVFASVPFSEQQRKRDKMLGYLKRKDQGVRSNFLLAENKPDDIAVEALRALRTSLFLRTMEARNNAVMITGATLRLGKTFVSANLATILAQAGKRVLLIDADMRKGYLHEMFNLESTSGLGEYLSGTSSSAFIKATNTNNLYLLTHGSPVDNPAELLGSERFTQMLTQFNADYDFVIVDAPPVLAVADANVIGQQTGTTLLVARFDETTVSDIEACVTRLRNNGIEVDGAVLNGVKRTASNYHSYDAYTKYSKSE